MPAQTQVLLASALVLHIAIAAILVRQYLRTRDVAFVWLGAAVVIWPLVSRLLEAGERVSVDRAMHSQFVIYPFTLVATGQMTVGSLITSFAVFQQFVGVCLLFVAVLFLSRAKEHTVRPVT